MVKACATGIGQQVLLAGKVDDAVLDAHQIGQGFQKQAHRIGRLEGDARQGFIGIDDRCLQSGSIRIREADGRERSEINGSH